MPRKRRQADPASAAIQPAVDELLANGRRINRATVDFLKVDVETALTFSGIALQTDNSVKKQRNQRSARKAYDSVLKLAENVDLTDQDAQILSRNLARLKSELQTLGEVF